MQNYGSEVTHHHMDAFGNHINADDVTSLLTTVLKELRELSEKFEKSDEANKRRIKSLTEEVTSLRSEVRELRNPGMQEIDTSFLPNLPFFVFDDFKEFDTMLLAEDEMRSQIKLIIQRVGGKDYPAFLRNAIKAIISDELAVNLTWRGTTEKPSIKLFTCFKLIKDVCHAKYSHATDVEINRVAQQHFLHAKDRILKRRKVAKVENSSF